MSKPASFRLEEDVIQAIKDGATAAGVSQADYLSGLVLGTADVPDDGKDILLGRKSADESERLQAALAKSIEYESQLAGLRDEIKELKRQLRASREPDAPKQAKPSEPPPEQSGQKCTHGTIWRLCKWAECRQRVATVPVVRPHSFHSGVTPFAGCDECKKLSKKAATA